MGFSYSKVDCFHTCPYMFKLRYIDKIQAEPDTSPSNALYLGTACHAGIEARSIDEAVNSYVSNYTELTPEHEVEIHKLKSILEKAIYEIPEGEYEVKLDSDDGFIGYIDCLVPVGDNEYDLLDFKYSNNIGGYSNSGQIHIYKYYYEKLTGNKIRNMFYVFIPKSNHMLDESLEDTKHRIDEDLKDKHIIMKEIPFDSRQVGWFFGRKVNMNKAIEEEFFPKCFSYKCKWCEYKSYCESKGVNTDGLIMEYKDE